MIARLLLSCVFLASLAIAAVGQNAPNATSGNCSPIIQNATSAIINCYQGETKENLQQRHRAVLDQLTSHTPVAYLIQEMGQPNMVGPLGAEMQIKVWNSIGFQMFAILRNNGVMSFGVVGEDDTKIPVLNWTDKSLLRHQKLKDQTCDSAPIEVDARYIYFEVSGCWQGRGGGYYYYEYAYYGHECLEDIDWGPVDFSYLIGLPCSEENTPFLALVRLDQTNAAPEPIVDLVTDFFFWTF